MRSKVPVLAAIILFVFLRTDWSGEIHEAAKNGNLERIQTLLKESPSLISSRDNEDATPLIVAAEFGRKDVAAFLLANHAEVNVKAKDQVFHGKNMSGMSVGATPLHSAVIRSDKEIAELLLRNETNINFRNGLGETPLHGAARAGDKSMVELLLAWTADVNATDNKGETSLYKACDYGRIVVARLLLAHKADPNVKTKSGRTPIHSVATRPNGDNPMMELLLANGAKTIPRITTATRPCI